MIFRTATQRTDLNLSYYYLNHIKIHILTHNPMTMDSFRRGLHSYLGAGAKGSLGVCLNWYILGTVTKKLRSLLLKLSMPVLLLHNFFSVFI
jgi:hypothetical protein